MSEWAIIDALPLTSSPIESNAMPKEFTVAPITLCVRLAGNHQAGVLLHRIVSWFPNAYAKIKGVDGHWIANKRSFWCQEANLSPTQCDRALRRLKELTVIEKRQHLFSAQSVLFVRPTQPVIQLVGDKRTRSEVETIFAKLKKGVTLSVVLAELGSAKVQNSEFSKFDVSSSADLPNSIYNTNEQEEPKGSASGALSFSGKEYSQGGFIPSMHKKPSKTLLKAWASTLKRLYGETQLPHIGTWHHEMSLAAFEYILADASGPDGSKVDYSPRGRDIIVHAIENWAMLGPIPLPTAPALCGCAELVIADWVKKGEPKYVDAI